MTHQQAELWINERKSMTALVEGVEKQISREEGNMHGASSEVDIATARVRAAKKVMGQTLKLLGSELDRVEQTIPKEKSYIMGLLNKNDHLAVLSDEEIRAHIVELRQLLGTIRVRHRVPGGPQTWLNNLNLYSPNVDFSSLVELRSREAGIHARAVAAAQQASV